MMNIYENPLETYLTCEICHKLEVITNNFPVPDEYICKLTNEELKYDEIGCYCKYVLALFGIDKQFNQNIHFSRVFDVSFK